MPSSDEPDGEGDGNDDSVGDNSGVVSVNDTTVTVALTQHVSHPLQLYHYPAGAQPYHLYPYVQPSGYSDLSHQRQMLFPNLYPYFPPYVQPIYPGVQLSPLVGTQASLGSTVPGAPTQANSILPNASLNIGLVNNGNPIVMPSDVSSHRPYHQPHQTFYKKSNRPPRGNQPFNTSNNPNNHKTAPNRKKF